MKITVRNILFSSMVLAAAAVTSSSALAAARFNVPFNFTVDGKVCPAGHYTVDKDINSRLITLQNNTTSQTFRWLLTPGDASASAVKATLRFDEVGEAHTLRSVKYGSMSASVSGLKVKHNSDIRTRTVNGE